MKPSDFERHTRGDGKRFHARTINGKFQVYGFSLVHVCECVDKAAAQMVCDALEAAADGEKAERKRRMELAKIPTKLAHCCRTCKHLKRDAGEVKYGRCQFCAVVRARDNDSSGASCIHWEPASAKHPDVAFRV